jgi:excisionase family DNA binding protein
MSDFPEVMTIEQVAEYLQLHPQVVYRHVKAGTLPASRIGRTIRFKKSVLDAFLEKDGWAAALEFVKGNGGGGGAADVRRGSQAVSKTVVETEPDATPKRVSARFSADVD